LTRTAQEALRAEINSRGIQSIASALAPSKAASSPDNAATGKSALVLIAQFLSLPQATLAKSILDSAGIDSFLADDNLVRMDSLISNILGGVKLFVRSDDLEAAKSILEQTPPEKFEVEGIGEYIQPRCPSCQSTDVSFTGPEKQRPYMSRFIGQSISVIKDDAQYWECHSCGRGWKDEDPELPPAS
jgi:Putative prokaryotic signal transducing protein